jgi:hypothetical protein
MKEPDQGEEDWEPSKVMERYLGSSKKKEQVNKKSIDKKGKKRNTQRSRTRKGILFTSFVC